MEQNNTEKKVVKLASRGKRFGAYLIDQVPAVIILIVIIVACVAAVAVSADGYYTGYGGYHDSPLSALAVGTGAVIICAILLLAYVVVQFIFFSKSQTIGKAILGMKVVHSETGEPVGFWWMLFRELFVKKASEAVFCLGYIWILIDDKNRGWHDKILDTYVIDIRDDAAREKKAESVTYTVSADDVRAENAQEVPVPKVNSVTEESADEKEKSTSDADK